MVLSAHCGHLKCRSGLHGRFPEADMLAIISVRNKKDLVDGRGRRNMTISVAVSNVSTTYKEVKMDLRCLSSNPNNGSILRTSRKSI